MLESKWSIVTTTIFKVCLISGQTKRAIVPETRKVTCPISTPGSNICQSGLRGNNRRKKGGVFLDSRNLRWMSFEEVVIIFFEDFPTSKKGGALKYSYYPMRTFAYDFIFLLFCLFKLFISFQSNWIYFWIK